MPPAVCRSKKEPHGRRHRVYVVMDDDGPDGERIPSSNAPDGTERVLVDRLPDNVSLAVAQERVRGLEDIGGSLKRAAQSGAGALQRAYQQSQYRSAVGTKSRAATSLVAVLDWSEVKTAHCMRP